MKIHWGRFTPRGFPFAPGGVGFRSRGLWPLGGPACGQVPRVGPFRSRGGCHSGVGGLEALRATPSPPTPSNLSPWPSERHLTCLRHDRAPPARSAAPPTPHPGFRVWGYPRGVTLGVALPTAFRPTLPAALRNIFIWNSAVESGVSSPCAARRRGWIPLK